MTSIASDARVVVETANRAYGLALLAVLEGAGFSVTVCCGPETLPGRVCPLAVGEGCRWVDHADVVVHDLDVDQPEHRAILRALRRTHPDIPIVLEVPESTARQHASLLEGCRVVYPFDMDRLVRAVTAAVDDRRRLGKHAPAARSS